MARREGAVRRERCAARWPTAAAAPARARIRRARREPGATCGRTVSADCPTCQRRPNSLPKKERGGSEAGGDGGGNGGAASTTGGGGGGGAGCTTSGGG